MGDEGDDGEDSGDRADPLRGNWRDRNVRSRRAAAQPGLSGDGIRSEGGSHGGEAPVAGDPGGRGPRFPEPAGRRRGGRLLGHPRRQHGGRRGAAPAHSGDTPRGDARRSDAAQGRHRRGGYTRQDDHDVSHRSRPRKRGARPHGHRRRQGAGPRRGPNRRQAWRWKPPGGRGGRERRLLPASGSGDRRNHQHRVRAPRSLRKLRGAPTGLRRPSPTASPSGVSRSSAWTIRASSRSFPS